MHFHFNVLLSILVARISIEMAEKVERCLTNGVPDVFEEMKGIWYDVATQKFLKIIFELIFFYFEIVKSQKKSN